MLHSVLECSLEMEFARRFSRHALRRRVRGSTFGVGGVRGVAVGVPEVVGVQDREEHVRDFVNEQVRPSLEAEIPESGTQHDDAAEAARCRAVDALASTVAYRGGIRDAAEADRRATDEIADPTIAVLQGFRLFHERLGL